MNGSCAFFVEQTYLPSLFCRRDLSRLRASNWSHNKGFGVERRAVCGGIDRL